MITSLEKIVHKPNDLDGDTERRSGRFQKSMDASNLEDPLEQKELIIIEVKGTRQPGSEGKTYRQNAAASPDRPVHHSPRQDVQHPVEVVDVDIPEDNQQGVQERNVRHCSSSPHWKRDERQVNKLLGAQLLRVSVQLDTFKKQLLLGKLGCIPSRVNKRLPKAQVVDDHSRHQPFVEVGWTISKSLAVIGLYLFNQN